MLIFSYSSCGNGSSDDPDASRICDQVMTQIRTQYPHLIDDISVMSMDPNDQLLNFLLSNAHVVLQLSTGEGFEVKLTEAQHAGRPVIATHIGGIALQVKHEETGFLVQPGDVNDVARRLMQLTTDQDLWNRMSTAAVKNVKDETTTVGNALALYYLATKLAQGDTIEGNGRWLSDLALQEAGYQRRHGDTWSSV
jgi:glycosyltransferase involved in cell wall biosynthesis